MGEYEVYTPEEIRKKAFKEAGVETADYPKPFSSAGTMRKYKENYPSFGARLKRGAFGAVKAVGQRMSEAEAAGREKQAAVDTMYAKAYGKARGREMRKLARRRAAAEFASSDFGLGGGLGFGSSEDSSILGFDLGGAGSIAHRRRLVGRRTARSRPRRGRFIRRSRGSMGIDLEGII